MPKTVASGYRPCFTAWEHPKRIALYFFTIILCALLTSGAAMAQTLFTTQTPASLHQSDGRSVNYELGMLFQTTTAGQITAIRFWKDSDETGSHTGRIWSASGQQLASVAFSGETASGWQQQSLATPLSIAANTTYVVSVNTGNTYYVATRGGLSSQVDSGPLRSVVGNNGVYGTSGRFPSNTYSSTNYFRDVAFVPASALSSLTLSSSTVQGGVSLTGTVALGGPAPATGAVVTLLSGNSAVTVPSSVVVPAAALTTTFPISTTGVSTLTSVVISGTFYTTASATLNVNPAILSQLAVSPSTVLGGGPSEGTVMLNGPAPPSGAIVTLSANNAAVTVPASVTVPAGATSTTFPIATSGVGSLTAAVVAGSYNGSQSATLTVNPAVLSTLLLSPASVVGGISSMGTITLSGPAPSGGAVVTLASDNAAATVAPDVVVPSGMTMATFPVATSTVGTAASANISATYLGTQTATLTINIATLSSLSLNPMSVTGGNPSTGTVNLTGPAPPGGAVVTLSSDQPIVAGIEGVSSQAALAPGGVVDWTSIASYTPIPSGTVMPIAGLPGMHMTLSTATSLPSEVLTNCSAGEDCAWWGNFAEGAGILWVNGTYSGDTEWWAPNGPLTVTFDSPQRGIGFQVMADESGSFTATLCAYNTGDTLLGCVPFRGNAASVADGTALFAGLYDDAQEISKVTIDGGGILYPHDFAIGTILVTNARWQIVPVSVTVPAGSTSADFRISTSAVTATTSVNITGTYIVTSSASLVINSPVLSTVTMAPASVMGGTSSVGTVTLTGPAPIGGAVVTLSANNAVAPGIQTVTSTTGLPQDGSVTWTDLGPSFTVIPSGTVAPVTGLNGLTVTLSTATGLPSMVLTNCPAIANCGWAGNFAPAAPLLWVGGNYDASGSWLGNGPLTVSLNTPQRGIGFAIMSDEVGPFTGNLCAYNAANAPLGCVPFSGTGAPLAGGTNGIAAYVGIYDEVSEISSVTVDAGGQLYPHDFAIGRLFVASSPRTTPPSVKVQPGAWTATFPVNTDKVTALTTITVSGTYQEDRAAVLTVYPETVPFSISGIVDLPGNTTSVTVTLSGTANATTSTDSSGYYTFSGLNNGPYTVTPNKPGFVFNPTSQNVTMSGMSLAGIDFAAPTYGISGTVSGAGPTTVTIIGPATASTTTSGTGPYAFIGLPSGTYTVNAFSAGYDFYPNTQTVTIGAASAGNVNFVAWPQNQTFTISGTVTPAGGGALVTLSGSATASVTADSSGHYAFTGVTGGTYTVTPSKNAYNFSPTSESRTIAGVDITDANFTAAVAFVNISVSPGSALLIAGGAEPFVTTVTGSPNTSVTWVATGGSISASGLYTAPNAPGTYTVTATSMADNTKSVSASVTVFAPTDSSVLMGDQNVEGQTDASLTLGPAAAFQVTANTTGNMQSIVVYLDSSSTASQLSAGLYSDTGGHPNLMLAQGSSTQLVPGAWNTIAVPSTVVVAGTPYWIALLGTSGGNPAFRHSSAAICSSETSAQNSLISLPSTWTTGVASSNCPVSAFGDSTKVLFFDTFANTSLSSNWQVISRHGEYSQSETECNVPQAVSVNNGLTITTTAQTWTCGDFNPNGTVLHAPAPWPYITGDVQWSKLNFTYGTVEVRAQFPSQATSLWPAIWLLGSNCQATNPFTGQTGVSTCAALGNSGYAEIDTTECYGSSWCQFHVANPNFGIGGGCDFSNYNVDTNHHIFKTIWNSSGITQYRDSVLLTTCHQSLSNPMFLIIQTQTGGVGGTPNNALLPAEFIIDYVKVTQP